ncbi:MAG TPA: threonine--tRNA ligase, partial [Nitrospirae bacterium]|nr:threonine--tRNA ligase [Nitrospirota bacterium]
MEAADAARAYKELKKAKAVAIRTEGRVLGLDAVGSLDAHAEIEALTLESAEGLLLYRHSVSHVMAHAVKELFPEAKIAIGPAIEDGFYYDFDLPEPFKPEDLAKIEKKMSQIIKKRAKFVRKEVSRAEAIELFKNSGEIYKVELLEEMEDESVSLYEEGGFTDLCRGPHIPDAGGVKAFKLLSIAGAYWRGDENKKMLQRIYGTAFGDRESLDKHLEWLEEIKKRDHRRLGRELALFSMNDEIGPGLILWHPDG